MTIYLPKRRTYIRKTRDEWQLWARYPGPHGWEHEISEEHLARHAPAVEGISRERPARAVSGAQSARQNRGDDMSDRLGVGFWKGAGIPAGPRVNSFIECGCCGAYHRTDFAGDCREDSERYNELPEGAELMWSGSCDPDDPANYWIDDATGERVNAETGERTPPKGRTT